MKTLVYKGLDNLYKLRKSRSVSCNLCTFEVQSEVQGDQERYGFDCVEVSITLIISVLSENVNPIKYLDDIKALTCNLCTALETQLAGHLSKLEIIKFFTTN